MRKILQLLIALLFIAIAYLVVINLLPDEELTAGARKWLAAEPVSVPKEQNSYYLLWGLDAPADVDMREYGDATVAKIIKINKKAADNNNMSDYDPDGFGETGRIEVVGIDELCEPGTTYCLDEYRQVLNGLLAAGQNALFLQRYRELSSSAHYKNVIPLENYRPIPHISSLLKAQRLHLVSIAASYVQGNEQGALDLLAEDLRFCRMLLAEADILVMRFVAIGMIARNLQIYSQLLEFEAPDGEVVKAVGGINELSSVERNFEPVMQGELQFMYQTLYSVSASNKEDTIGGRIVRATLPFRKRGLINRTQEQFNKIVELGSLPPSRIVQESEKILQEFEPDRWDYIRDPLTSLIFAIRAPDFSHYLLRHYDLNGLIRLLKLKALIKNEGVTADKIAAFIAASPYASAYPEEMSAVRWEAGAQVLTFDSALGERASKRNRIFIQVE